MPGWTNDAIATYLKALEKNLGLCANGGLYVKDAGKIAVLCTFGVTLVVVGFLDEAKASTKTKIALLLLNLASFALDTAFDIVALSCSPNEPTNLQVAYLSISIFIKLSALGLAAVKVHHKHEASKERSE